MPLKHSIRALIAAPVLLSMLPANGAVVQHLSFRELTTQATHIVEAEVVGDSERTDIRNGTPWTCQTLRIIRLLKGSAGPTKEVCFYGGKIGGYTYAASGLTLPKLGRRGFFFLQDDGKNYVNPVVGWDQGAYYIDKSTSGEIVTTSGGEPIASIDLAEGNAKPAPISGAAAGVNLDPSGQLAPSAFIEITLRALSDAGR